MVLIRMRRSHTVDDLLYSLSWIEMALNKCHPTLNKHKYLLLVKSDIKEKLMGNLLHELVATHNLSLEEVNTEYEHTWYVELSDDQLTSYLNASTYEDHTQYEIQMVVGNNVMNTRTRHTQYIDGTDTHEKVEITYKPKMEGHRFKEATIEDSAESTVMDIHQLYGIVSQRKFYKRRITVQHNEHHLEIDIYRNREGDWHNWVKVDLEVPVGKKVPHLSPITGAVKSIYVSPIKSLNDEQRAFLGTVFWDHVLLNQ